MEPEQNKQEQIDSEISAESVASTLAPHEQETSPSVEVPPPPPVEAARKPELASTLQDTQPAPSEPPQEIRPPLKQVETETAKPTAKPEKLVHQDLSIIAAADQAPPDAFQAGQAVEAALEALMKGER